MKKLTKTFDQRDNRKENDDWNFQTLYQIADIKMQRFHASENLMTQFTFSLLQLPWGLQAAQKPVYINEIISNLFINIHWSCNFIYFLWNNCAHHFKEILASNYGNIRKMCTMNSKFDFCTMNTNFEKWFLHNEYKKSKNDFCTMNTKLKKIFLHTEYKTQKLICAHWIQTQKMIWMMTWCHFKCIFDNSIKFSLLNWSTSARTKHSAKVVS